MLQARGREMAKVLLTGILRGTFPFTMRHIQSIPPFVRDLSELQQSAVGDVPLLLLFVRKFMQGDIEFIMEALHGVLICALADLPMKIATANIMARRHIGRKYSIFVVGLGLWI